MSSACPARACPEFHRRVGPSEIRYLYDASGNKLQKQVEIFECPPFEQCPGPATSTTDYIGNFVYRGGHLTMVYHPEGVIRPTPPSADNTTDYVYDYFIKDYLGNVRVVLTEENATYDTSLVATMDTRAPGMPFGIPGEGYARSAYLAAWEEENFDGIGEGREPKPLGYPMGASFPFNRYVAEVVAENEMTIGPSKVMMVERDQRIKVATRYFFQEDAGRINDYQMILEQSSNAYSTFGGIHGAAWGIGWELGRTVTSIPGYHEGVRVPLQRLLGIRP